jgi:hypothetical protein
VFDRSKIAVPVGTVAGVQLAGVFQSEVAGGGEPGRVLGVSGKIVEA